MTIFVILLFVVDMPRPNKRKSQVENAARNRWNFHNQGKQAECGYAKEREDDFSDSCSDDGFDDKIAICDVGAIFELCKADANSRKLSLLLFMTLRHFNINWRQIDEFLFEIRANRCITARKWMKSFVNGDIDELLNDGRGGKQTDSFYDVYPEIEVEARIFVTDACSRKSADFNIARLANFVTEKFHYVNSTAKPDNVLVRSLGSCRLDLGRWGLKFDCNAQRPYFEGHERPDVVAHREKFISYFLDRRDHYYSITDGDQPMWRYPTKNPCVLICKLGNRFIT